MEAPFDDDLWLLTAELGVEKTKDCVEYRYFGASLG